VSELQAVLFDMDGTLCDTEAMWMAAEFALAARCGAPWTHEDGLRLVGSDLLVSGAYIRRRMGLTLSPEEIVSELLTTVVASVASDGVSWRPGAIELLVECNDRGVPTALVTMSYRVLVDAVVAALPAGRFDAVVTGQDVERGKPAPDAYALAADLLGVEATASIAIEDSATGAASGAAAGCLVLAVPHTVPIPRSVAPHQVATLGGTTLEQLRALARQR
jgi:HAD superfamily hydrolase (TIGR01509 family)